MCSCLSSCRRAGVQVKRHKWESGRHIERYPRIRMVRRMARSWSQDRHGRHADWSAVVNIRHVQGGCGITHNRCQQSEQDGWQHNPVGFACYGSGYRATGSAVMPKKESWEISLGLGVNIIKKYSFVSLGCVYQKRDWRPQLALYWVHMTQKPKSWYQIFAAYATRTQSPVTVWGEVGDSFSFTTACSRALHLSFGQR